MKKFDPEIAAIADYVASDCSFSEKAYATARFALLDSLGCLALGLASPECRRAIGTGLSGDKITQRSPADMAFAIGTGIRFHDFNDTWLAAEWGHPSDNLGALLAAACLWKPSLTVGDILSAMIKAYEIQGIMALENSFNKRGIDHVILVKLASATVAAWILTRDKEIVMNAISQVWCDGAGPLRLYRHAPNVGPRKSWAAGDATSRGLFLALLSARGETGYPMALSTPLWGFYERAFGGERFAINQPYGSYVMENILFKVRYPAEFHGQTAVEAAVKLHSRVKDWIGSIHEIKIWTQGPAMQIINKAGPLTNYADRDHCLQYMTAVALLNGTLTAYDYSDAAAKDPRIDALREKMKVRENQIFTLNYYTPTIRSIANTVSVEWENGQQITERVDFPLGHCERREEALPFKWIPTGLRPWCLKQLKLRLSSIFLSLLLNIAPDNIFVYTDR